FQFQIYFQRYNNILLLISRLIIWQYLSLIVHIYRAFNTLGWENFADALFDGIPADLFYCGSNSEARTTVEQLISDIGLRPVSLGDTAQVDLVDAFLRVWFALAVGQCKGRHLAFKVLTR
ncbi:MAG: hypothetical protein ABI406_07160, partial [Ktedonobacteraceae bacterium]